MNNFKFDAKRLKETWISDVTDIVKEFSKLSFDDYIKKREEITKSFADYFEKNKNRIEKSDFKNLDDFITTYSETYEIFQNFCAIDFILDQKDPFDLWKNTISEIRKVHNEYSEEDILGGLNRIFAGCSLDDIFPFIIRKSLINSIENAQYQYSIIKEHQDENGNLFEKYNKTFNSLEAQAILVMQIKGMTTEEVIYLPHKQKLELLKNVNN